MEHASIPTLFCVLLLGCILQIAMEKIFQAVGSMKTTMALLIVGCLINIILGIDPDLWSFRFPCHGHYRSSCCHSHRRDRILFPLCDRLLETPPYHAGQNPALSSLCMDTSIIKQIYSVGIPSTIMIVLPIHSGQHFKWLTCRIFRYLCGVFFGIYYKLQVFLHLSACQRNRSGNASGDRIQLRSQSL